MLAQRIINWRDVSSSNVEKVGWPKVGVAGVPAAPAALVQFRDGSIYAYLGVSRQRAVAMACSKSVGRYLNEKIKPTYEAVRIA